MATFFISDLHLDPSAPEIGQQFLAFLTDAGRNADALYILGDLFEVWVGDDDDAPYTDAMVTAIRDYSESIPTFFMRGNRDFLIGERFATRTGVTVLDDPAVITLNEQPVLLSHGDQYCTDDVAYQAFRQQSRDPTWQQQILSLPLADRRVLAESLRQQSQHAMSGKDAAIMDVNAAAITAALRAADVTTMLHGHTHRPTVHRFLCDGAPCTRIVLGDWYDQASFLRWDSGGFELAVDPR
ncbi:MAG: UDP-2,3-diacylglucosamine diphosphatase [Pseudomonadota bacterium]